MNDWKARCYRKLAHWAKRQHCEFLFEEFRQHVRIEEPKSPNAWGAVCRAAANEGLIKWTGQYARAKAAAARGRVVRVYRA